MTIIKLFLGNSLCPFNYSFYTELLFLSFSYTRKCSRYTTVRTIIYGCKISPMSQGCRKRNHFIFWLGIAKNPAPKHCWSIQRKDRSPKSAPAFKNPPPPANNLWLYKNRLCAGWKKSLYTYYLSRAISQQYVQNNRIMGKKEAAHFGTNFYTTAITTRQQQQQCNNVMKWGESSVVFQEKCPN